MTQIRRDPTPMTPKPTARSSQEGGESPSGSPQEEPKPKLQGDRLQLSAPPKKLGPLAPEPPAPEPPKSPEPPSSEPQGPSIETELTDRDVTLGLRLGENTRLSGRYVMNSPTMMQGAGLLKIDHQLTDNTTLFAGVGHMPGFYRNSIGPNQRIDSPTSAVFLGAEDLRDKRHDLGHGFNLDLSLHSVAVATVAYNHAESAVDPNLMGGLSKATVTGEAMVSRQFGSVDARLGYGNHLDLGMIGSYYFTGGRGLFPQTHYLQGGLSGKAGSVAYQADAFVPIATATNAFASSPRARLAVSAPLMPDLAAELGKDGLDRINASKSFAFGKGWEGTASVTVDRPMSSQRQYQAGIGVRYNFGGKPQNRPVSRPHDDYRMERSPVRSTAPVPVGRPQLRDFFSRDQIAQMKGKSVEELAQVLKTPEQVVAYLGEFVTYDDDRLEDAKGNYGSMTPNEVARLLKGVCRDQHPFMVSLMKEGAGIEGKTIGYTSPGTAHAISVYRNPETGKWNVIEYDRIHYTEADTAEAAFTHVRPDALVHGEWSEGGPNDRTHQKSIRYSDTAREWYRFVQPSRN